MVRSNAMTIGQLSRRTGESIKVLRTYEDLGFLCTRGRSEGNYRLFGEETLRCVPVVRDLRSLGLTLKEIQILLTRPKAGEGPSMRVLLEASLRRVLTRVEAQISTLQALQQRILEFQINQAGTLTWSEASALAHLLARDPCCHALPSPS